MGPDFICLGAQKAGTAWLSQCLQTHPDLWNPGIKELHFFDKAKFTEKNQNLIVSLNNRRLNKIKRAAKSGKFSITQDLAKSIIRSGQITFQEYLTLFALAPRMSKTWEITPSYGSMSYKKLKQMNKLLPNTKYLYILRDPVSRALSSLRMSLERKSNRGVEQSTIIDQWLNKQLNRGRYSKHIPKMNKILGGNQKLVYLPFGLLKTDPQEFMNRVEMHIGISKGNYNNLLSKPYHQTSKSVIIPASTQATIERELQPEIEFIASFFGDEFARKCA